MRVTTRTVLSLILSAAVLVGLASTAVETSSGSGDSAVAVAAGANSVIWD